MNNLLWPMSLIINKLFVSILHKRKRKRLAIFEHRSFRVYMYCYATGPGISPRVYAIEGSERDARFVKFDNAVQRRICIECLVL